MDFTQKSNDELLERRQAIAEELNAPEADLDALEEEVRAINTELETRKANEAKRVELRAAVANGAGEVTKEIKEEKHDMTNEEIRSSEEYRKAFAEYIKSEDDTEVRALLTVNTSSGYVPVPTVVDDAIHTAWERADLMRLVRKTYLKGNLKVGFELTADPAYIHVEGAAAATEEALTLGIVDIIPKSIKKWITISDEANDLTNIIDYVYDELTYRIAKKAEDELINLIDTAGTSASSTAVGVPTITVDSSNLLYSIAIALGELSDEARNPVVVMNKQTYPVFKSAAMAASYAVDPFEGLDVHFNNTLAAITTASTGDCVFIVGDFGMGAQANFPNGDEIRIKYDDLSLAEKDLIKLVGREYVGLGLVADKAFVKGLV